jgi:putative membrane protein
VTDIGRSSETVTHRRFTPRGELGEQDGPVSAAPTLSDLVTQWRVDWGVVVVALLLVLGYLRARRRLSAERVRWPVRRDVALGLGVLALVWTGCGFLQARATQLMWVFTVQQLLLLLVVPIIVLAAQPVALLRSTAGRRSVVIRALDSRPLRVLGSPLVGPLLVPVLCFLLFFGGLGEAAVTSPEAGTAVRLLMFAAGLLLALPLVDAGDDRSSLAVGLALGVGIVELIIDAFPGIVLRFQTHLTIPHFGLDRPLWAGGWLDDQHTAGSILWVVAEILDLPFLVLAATRWWRADAREAARIDAVLDASETAAAQEAGPREPGRPWFLDDPRLQDRYRAEAPRTQEGDPRSRPKLQR